MAGLHPSPRLSLPRQWPHGARPSAAVVVSCQVGGPRGSAAFRSSCVFACQPCRSPSSCSSFFSTIQPSARQASQPSAPPAPPIPLPSNPPAPHPSPLSAPPTPPAARAPPPPRRRVSSRRIMTWIACSSLWRRGSEKGGVRQMRAHPQIQTPRQALYLALPHLQTTSCRLAPPHEPITGSCMSLLPVPPYRQTLHGRFFGAAPHVWHVPPAPGASGCSVSGWSARPAMHPLLTSVPAGDPARGSL